MKIICVGVHKFINSHFYTIKNIKIVIIIFMRNRKKEKEIVLCSGRPRPTAVMLATT